MITFSKTATAQLQLITGSPQSIGDKFQNTINFSQRKGKFKIENDKSALNMIFVISFMVLDVVLVVTCGGNVFLFLSMNYVYRLVPINCNIPGPVERVQLILCQLIGN